MSKINFANVKIVIKIDIKKLSYLFEAYN